MNERPVVGFVEEVILQKDDNTKRVKARVDTGATKSSIDVSLAAEFGLGPVIGKKKVKSSLGVTIRPIIKTRIEFARLKMEGEFTVADRSHMTYPILIGQDILKEHNFIVDPHK